MLHYIPPPPFGEGGGYNLLLFVMLQYIPPPPLGGGGGGGCREASEACRGVGAGAGSTTQQYTRLDSLVGGTCPTPFTPPPQLGRGGGGGDGPLLVACGLPGCKFVACGPTVGVEKCEPELGTRHKCCDNVQQTIVVSLMS